ncbi:hypothetical protein [Magnetococcus marinus]|uniref:hypothetical protein n=1 Tax=Magnetococcus marinus TaxID=1124597 RepID=UPI00003C5932|nr:hypothetical protein [Magnetococcus marinus]
MDTDGARKRHAVEALKQSLLDLDQFMAEHQDGLEQLVVDHENGLARLLKKRHMLKEMMAIIA